MSGGEASKSMIMVGNEIGPEDEECNLPFPRAVLGNRAEKSGGKQRLVVGFGVVAGFGGWSEGGRTLLIGAQ